MSERDIIGFVRALSAGEDSGPVRIGIGDDAAVVDLPGGAQLVLTTDAVIDGVHFVSGTAPALVGRKAAARALSDIAAMAARPLCVVAAVAVGQGWDDESIMAMLEALSAAAAGWGAPLVGGDVAATPGPTAVTVTAIGTPGPAGVVTRAGARTGDAVCVTGRLGGSIRGRHLTFAPRTEEALSLAADCDVHAMIDLSDGLSTDALHLAEEGRAGMLIRLADIPISDDAVLLAAETGRSPTDHALNDGEDYELLFCVPAGQGRDLSGAGVGDAPVTVIGEVIDGEQCWIEDAAGQRLPLQAKGWEHLA